MPLRVIFSLHTHYLLDPRGPSLTYALQKPTFLNSSNKEWPGVIWGTDLGNNSVCLDLIRATVIAWVIDLENILLSLMVLKISPEKCN